jgi:UDP-glucose 4-epimerase
VTAPFTILGSQGFIGSHLARHLRERGFSVSCPERHDDSIFARPLGHVMYCAGLTADYAARPFDTVEAHVTLLADVLKRCDFLSLVYLSSTRLYDSAGAVGVETQPLMLNPNEPRHLYDFSKGLGEWLCIHTGRGRARVARLSSVYSTDLSSDNFLHTVLRMALEGRPASIDTSGNLSRDYIDVDDVCPMLVEIALRGTRSIYNVAGGENTANAEIFDRIQMLTGCRLTPSRPPSDQVSPVIDISTVVDELGLRPRRVLDRLPEILAAHSEKAH